MTDRWASRVDRSPGFQVNRRRLGRRMKTNYQLYLFVLPAIVYFFIFHYIPMYGVQIAFRDFMATEGFAGSPWVGLKHFRRFFNSFEFWRLIRNTVTLSFFQLLFTFPIPIIIALMLNYLRSRKYRRFVQTVLYAPHFISQVVLVGIVFVFLSPRSGLINHLIESLGGESVFFMAEPGWFKPLYIGTSVWQGTGWNSIIYLAALSAISPELHEAAICDGARKLQRIWHIDIPGIMPTAVILLILSMGRLMNIGFEKAYLMQTSLNISASEIIPTYVYKTGLLGAQFSFSTAVELFNSIINLVLLLMVNRVARSVSETSLW